MQEESGFVFLKLCLNFFSPRWLKPYLSFWLFLLQMNHYYIRFSFKFIAFIIDIQKNKIFEVFCSKMKYIVSVRMSTRIFHLWKYIMNMSHLLLWKKIIEQTQLSHPFSLVKILKNQFLIQLTLSRIFNCSCLLMPCYIAIIQFYLQAMGGAVGHI